MRFDPTRERLVDLSLPLESDGAWSPRWARTTVRRQSHAFGAWAIRWLFGVPRRLLKTGLGWANETLHLSTHGTTHVDAPFHYGPTCAGKPARTIDAMPLDWFCGPVVVLDVRHLPSDAAVSPADLDAALAAIGHRLSPGEIVLFRTGNDRLWGTRAYFDAGPGIGAAATRQLLDCGIRLTGIDAWGWDRPLRAQARDALRSQRADLFWEAHYVGVEREYCHIERLAGLDRLPPSGAYLWAFPLRVLGGSAGPARVVACVPREEGAGGTGESVER